MEYKGEERYVTDPWRSIGADAVGKKGMSQYEVMSSSEKIKLITLTIIELHFSEVIS